MEYITMVFDYLSSLGNYVMIPVIVTVIGICVGVKIIKALKAGITVGIGLIGLDLIMGLVWTYIGPVSEALVDTFGLNLSIIDTGWPTAAGIAFSTEVGALIIPFGILLNVVAISLKATRTVNIDIWDFWHYAFAGSVAYLVSGDIIVGFVAAATVEIICFVVADRTAKLVNDEMGIPGVSIPHAASSSQVPIALAVEKVFSIFSKGEKKEVDTSKIESNKILNTIKDPVYLGLIIGTVLALLAGYAIGESVKVGICMSALLFLLPRMVQILMEGFVPISTAAKKFMTKRYGNKEFYIGMDCAVLLGHPTTLSVGLLLIPITLVLAMIIPINGTLPLGDLAATAYMVTMCTVIHRGDFLKTLISGSIFIALSLILATLFAPFITDFAISSAMTIPEGAAQITALTAGNIFTYALYVLAQYKYVGLAIMVAIDVVLLVWNMRYIKKLESEAAAAAKASSELETE